MPLEYTSNLGKHTLKLDLCTQEHGGNNSYACCNFCASNLFYTNWCTEFRMYAGQLHCS